MLVSELGTENTEVEKAPTCPPGLPSLRAQRKPRLWRKWRHQLPSTSWVGLCNIYFCLRDATGLEELVFPDPMGGLEEVRGGVIEPSGNMMKSFAERQVCSDLSVFPHDFIPQLAMLGP